MPIYKQKPGKTTADIRQGETFGIGRRVLVMSICLTAAVLVAAALSGGETIAQLADAFTGIGAASS